METLSNIQSAFTDKLKLDTEHKESVEVVTPHPLALPPKTSFDKFSKFIAAARDVCGGANTDIVHSDKQLEGGWYLEQSKHHDMHAILGEGDLVASAVISPSTVPEVQTLVKLANEYEIPLWPISLGRNVGYGGAAPRVRGSVVLDMGKNMNKILNVDADSATCLVEPGVSFQDLYDYLVKNKLDDKLWIDVPDLGGGSVLGNCLDRGVGYTPYGDHFMVHCGMEIVLPNGELYRTGMGAMPDPTQPGYDPSAPLHEQPPNKCWQLFNYGFGPYLDGIFTQSSLGIVTKLGMWLMPDPGGFENYVVTVPKEEQLRELVDVIRPLRLQNILPNVPTIRYITLDAAVMGHKLDYVNHDGPLTEEELTAISTKLGLGRWNFYGAAYGPPLIRNAMMQISKEAFSKIPGAKFLKLEDVQEPSVLHIRAKTLRGIPSYDELNWLEWEPNGVHLFFAPISQVSGEDAMKQYEISKRRFDEAGFDFVGTFTIGMREMHHIISVIFPRGNEERKKAAVWLIRTLIDDCAKMGWGEYRTHLGLMDQIQDTYSFNNNIQRTINETIKNALDPKGIIAPGKSGIWPASYDKKTYVLDSKVPKPF